MTLLEADVRAALQSCQVKYNWKLYFSQSTNVEPEKSKKVHIAVNNEYLPAFDEENDENQSVDACSDEYEWLVDDVSEVSADSDKGIFHDSHFNSPQKTRVIKKGFNKNRDRLVTEYYKCYNEIVFDNQLPADLSIKWNNRMLTTAGYAKMPRTVSPRTATIELSTKVNDTVERLRATLLHEMCHVAAWIIDAVTKPPHGATFRKWADRAERKLHIPVTTCHSYDVHKPHTFKCCNNTCGQEYHRHSKRSINTQT